MRLEAEELLVFLYEARESVPISQRQPFYIPSAGNRTLTLQHPGLPLGEQHVIWSALAPLLDAKLVEIEWRPAPSGIGRVGSLLITTEGRDYVFQLRKRMSTVGAVSGPRLFIVHGHDDTTKLSVKNYLQNVLRLPEPIILHEQPDRGRTIIEKFEEVAQESDGAVVLLTPDDQYVNEGSNEELRRARQNVILELGYFLAHFGRRSGKVLLLYKGRTEIPSDLSGVVYIDISNGVDAAGERIRRELNL